MAGFSDGRMQITFHEPPSVDPWEKTGAAKVVEAVGDDGHSTSPKRVAGFNNEPAQGFKHPSLWPSQNGKTLRFTGNLE